MLLKLVKEGKVSEVCCFTQGRWAALTIIGMGKLRLTGLTVHLDFD